VLLYPIVIICEVPIYDAWKFNKSFYKLVLQVDQLSHIKCKLHSGSCAVVAYTANTWGAPINISFNVKWVMLLGVP
jgi:hypothetical protein